MHLMVLGKRLGKALGIDLGSRVVQHWIAVDYLQDVHCITMAILSLPLGHDARREAQGLAARPETIDERRCAGLARWGVLCCCFAAWWILAPMPS